jgi:hypothetical protein
VPVWVYSCSIFVLTLACLTAARAQGPADHRHRPLQLSQDGHTQYRIVIGREAEAGEVLAAQELSQFLGRITGARFPVRRDTVPPVAREIVLGRTNRYDIGSAPPELQPATLEGFLIDWQESRLIIAGTIPRASLYGVYDFLERELGCRFLAPGVEHVPHLPTLTVNVVSRRYDPPLEYRNIYAEEQWAVRNRLNATWSWVPMEKALGGVRFAGPSFVHTFGHLVPSETHFAGHPEYYALVDGKRHRAEGGVSGQLCLTHPDVLRIATDSARGWIGDHGDTLQSRLIVSISPNDNGLVCECPQCAAVNNEEGSQSGTLIRFVNGVAEALEADFPTVRVETLAYGPSLQPPAHTRPRDNVIIRFAPIGAEFARPLDDPASDLNRPTFESITRWSAMGAGIYVWHYVVNFHAYFKPFPNLRVLGHDVRFLRDQGMKGLYAQGSQTPGSDLRAMRDYLLARLMWRPETHARQTIEEFCRLYYGAGAAGVLQYVDLLHDEVERLGEPLMWNDGSRAAGIVYSDAFLAAADATLAGAEAAAEAPEQKLRVATERLSVWYLVLQGAFGATGRLVSLPLEWYFRADPDDAGVRERWQSATEFAGWSTIRTDAPWTAQGHEHHGTAWYAIAFDLPETARGRSLALHFGAVDGICDVFLDGVQVGEQKEPPEMMWDKPFSIALPDPVLPGRHVLTVRVEKQSHAGGIWKPVAVLDAATAAPERVREAGRRFMEVSRAIGVTHMSEFYGPPGEQLEKEFYPKIEALLRRPTGHGTEPPPGVLRHSAAALSNPHRTFTVVGDEEALEGSCASQTADRVWTLGQAIRWDITEPLQASADGGSFYRLRARIKVAAPGTDGLAFRFGYAWQEADYAAGLCAEIQVRADEIPDGGWHWYELPEPVQYRAAPHGQFAFVWPADNAANVDAVCLDAFELVPVR